MPKPTLSPLTSGTLTHPSVTHGFFTRLGGVSTELYHALNGGLGSQDHPDHVAENRARMAAHLHVGPAHFLSLYQIHSSDCVIVNDPWPIAERPRADAMATRFPGLALAIGTADCGPLLFADTDARVIGAAHAGWKGAIGGVIESTLDAMERLGARRARINAVLGPTISQDAYEVGPEFREQFVTRDAASARFFTAQNEAGKCRFDLPGFIVARLEAAKIGSIENLALCTYGDEHRFFSFRRATHRGEADYGRLIAAIALNP